LGLAFFGLTPNLASEYRVSFLTEIHEICFYGQGGYSWNEVYDMPLWLRKFVYKKVIEHYQKQAEQIEAAKNKTSPNTKNLIDPNGLPTKSKYK
jgi:hypothetical protein